MGKYPWSDTGNTDEELKIYYVLSADYLKDHPMCECCKKAFATEIHHKKGRGIWLNIVKYFLAVCRLCHDKIEEHPDWAKQNNYSLSRLNLHDEVEPIPEAEDTPGDDLSFLFN